MTIEGTIMYTCVLGSCSSSPCEIKRCKVAEDKLHQETCGYSCRHIFHPRIFAYIKKCMESQMGKLESSLTSH